MAPLSGIGLGNTKPEYIRPLYSNKYSFDFDGTDDHINIGKSSVVKPTTFDTSEGTGITVSAWCKNDAWDHTSSGYPTSTQHIVGCVAVGGWAIATDTTRFSCALNIPDGAGNTYLSILGPYKSIDTSGDISYRSGGLWCHVVMTYDGRTLRFYINGAEEGSRHTDTTDSGADDTPIRYGSGNYDVDAVIGADSHLWNAGTETTSITNPWNGLIDQVAIWNKAIDSAAVTELYEAVNTDGTPLELTVDYGDYDYSNNLTAWWTAEEGSGSSAIDYSTGSTTGTLLHDTTYSSTVPE